MSHARLIFLATASLLASSALAQPDPSGIDFVTVGAVGNRPYDGPDINGIMTGRGQVNYEYRLGRTEVTTAQWMEFYNLFADRVPHVNVPFRWGAFDTGRPTDRFVLASPEAALYPVSGPTWRTAAMFCNWLHNDKRTDLSAVMNGAYDVSTFGYEEGTITFTDQPAHHPDARYWIPTTDEWIKAGFYDPNYGGQGVGGWYYNTPTGTNTPLIHGPPGQGQANTNFDLPNNGHYRIPLGAYPDVRSPWGCLDMAGGTAEFNETIWAPGGTPPNRFAAGSHWTSSAIGSDAIYGIGSEFPSIPSLFYGLRVAASIPSPSTIPVFILTGFIVARRRR